MSFTQSSPQSHTAHMQRTVCSLDCLAPHVGAELLWHGELVGREVLELRGGVRACARGAVAEQRACQTPAGK